MPSPLTKPTLRRLIVEHLLPAWHALGEPGGDFDVWRHEFIAHHLRKAGLRCCTEEDVQPLIAHCWDARGRPDIAMQLLLQDPRANERRQVEWKITQALSEAGLKIGYAIAICRRIFKCGLDEASTDQLWKLYYTVKARAAAHANSRP